MKAPFITYILSCIFYDTIRYFRPHDRIQQINLFYPDKIKTISLSLLNLIIGTYLGSYLRLENNSCSKLLNLFKLLCMFFLGDTAFYWSHRFMHIPKIYKFCHKLHHTHNSPISWTSLYVHPGEFLIALLGIFILPVKLMNADQNTASLYWSLIMLSLVSSHSGMRIPSFLSAEHHDEHHKNPKKNFGSDIGIWDYICGT